MYRVSMIIFILFLSGCADIAYMTGDYDSAIRQWRLDAEQGDANAQNNLGHMYDYGEGVPEDDKVAVKWYTLAAEQGLAISQFSLGVMYGNGYGVPVDHKASVKWFTLAAEQGHADAQTNLGVKYMAGEGVSKNVQAALKWYARAVEQKNQGAMFNLGSYELSDRKDNVRALMWYTLSTSQGGVMAQFNKIIVESVKNEMSPIQIEAAHKLARDCEAKNYKGC